MLKIEKILFATDFSNGAAWGGVYARSIARATGAELHVLFADVLHSDALQPSGRWAGEEALARLEAEMANANEREQGLPRVITKHAVRRNFSPGPAILEYAAEEDVDLIVTGTHGRRGVSRIVLGSVAEEVVRLAGCPVLTVRGRGEDVPSSLPIGPIVAPIDFSAHSSKALSYAGELARLFHTDLHLLHVVEETLHPAFYGLTVQSIYDVSPSIDRKAEEQMAKMLRRIVGDDVEATITSMPGKAAGEIAEYASALPDSLIVMGTHGLTGIEHFLMGSTTERVVRHATAPVFSVKSFGKSLLKPEPLVAANAFLTPEIESL